MDVIEELVPEIECVVEEIRKDYIIKNEIIRDDVFGILEEHCTVMYYPINDKNNGFHTKRVVGESLQDFVYINTAKETELQVFTAAHELGHIWDVAKKVWERSGRRKSDLSEKLEEDITDRFAAELLMPRDVFGRFLQKKYEEYGRDDGKISLEELIQMIVFLMNTFLTPYESVCRRLIEIGVIQMNTKKFLEERAEEISIGVSVYAGEQNYRLGGTQRRKSIANIREMLEEAEQKGSLSQRRIDKIKQDFDIKDVRVEENILKIRIGGNLDEDETEGSC